MARSGHMPEATLVCVDLRQGVDELSLDGAQLLAAAEVTPATLARLEATAVVVLWSGVPTGEEAALRSALENAQVKACWIRVASSGADGPVSSDPAVRLVEVLSEAASLAASLPAVLDAGPKPLPLELEQAVGRLSPREQEVLAQVRRGQSNKEIGSTLFLSPHTVGNHLRSIYRKLGVTGRHDLLARLAHG